MVATRVNLPMDVIADFCKRRQIKQLELFGSALRDDFGPESDLDFLYVLDPPDAWIFSDFLDAQEELAGLLGRDVDLISRHVIEQSPNPWRRRNILGAARVVYAVYQELIWDVVMAARALVRYAEGTRRPDLDEEPMRADAMTRQIGIIGEAAGKLSSARNIASFLGTR
jgi:predicted nucleotidyltransferase